MKKILTILIVAITALSANAANIVQSSNNGGSYMPAGSDKGQSFTSTGTDLDSISVWLEEWNVHLAPSFTVTVDLYEGVGYAGPLVDSLTLDLTGHQPGWADFDFSGNLLALGDSYTFKTTSTGRGGQYYESANVYAGGTSFFNGSANPNTDLAFKVTYGNSATPEPSSYALMLIGLLGLVAFGRRQRAQIA
ncbi:MAG: PEP-CTERM sorting domain-containing protein [Lentisphaeraceae bacterium]|nr:PEP-CTERM sorting domain-containing protein [Lentisphaeraceae bacterium]